MKEEYWVRKIASGIVFDFPRVEIDTAINSPRLVSLSLSLGAKSFLSDD